MDEEQLTPAELGEVISTASFVLGLASGWNDAAAHLRKLAGQMFAAGSNDDRAFFLRGIADELEEVAKKERAEYDTTRRPEKEAAFRELDKLSKGESK